MSESTGYHEGVYDQDSEKIQEVNYEENEVKKYKDLEVYLDKEEIMKYDEDSEENQDVEYDKDLEVNYDKDHEVHLDMENAVIQDEDDARRELSLLNSNDGTRWYGNHINSLPWLTRDNQRRKIEEVDSKLTYDYWTPRSVEHWPPLADPPAWQTTHIEIPEIVFEPPPRPEQIHPYHSAPLSFETIGVLIGMTFVVMVIHKVIIKCRARSVPQQQTSDRPAPSVRIQRTNSRPLNNDVPPSYSECLRKIEEPPPRFSVCFLKPKDAEPQVHIHRQTVFDERGLSGIDIDNALNNIIENGRTSEAVTMTTSPNGAEDIAPEMRKELVFENSRDSIETELRSEK